MKRRIRKRMFAVSRKGIGIVAGTMAYSRREAIGCLFEIHECQIAWPDFKRAGYRTVEARVTIVTKGS